MDENLVTDWVRIATAIPIMWTIAWGAIIILILTIVWWALDMTINWKKHLLHVPGPWPLPILGKIYVFCLIYGSGKIST